MIRLKPYFLQERKVLINIIDYPLCTVEKNKTSIKQTETNSVNYLKIWLNHFCTSLLPASSSLPPVFSSLLPIHFQSTSSFHPTSRGTFMCQIFDFLLNYYKLIGYTVWTNNDIIDNPLCNIEKTKQKWSNKLKERVWTT